MKELLSFTFALLFIACQNQPFSHLDANPASAVTVAAPALIELETTACQTQSEMTLDVAKELADAEMPGFHYRETPVRSEFDFQNGYEALTCASNVSSSDDSADVESAIHLAPADNVDVMARAELWLALTEKWEVRPQIATCIDHNAQKENPSCQDLVFVAEEGKFFSPASEEEESLQVSNSEPRLLSLNESFIANN